MIDEVDQVMDVAADAGRVASAAGLVIAWARGRLRRVDQAKTELHFASGERMVVDVPPDRAGVALNEAMGRGHLCQFVDDRGTEVQVNPASVAFLRPATASGRASFG
jgi:hypothetical protein